MNDKAPQLDTEIKAPIPPDAIPQERITGDILRGYGPRRGNLERLLRYWRPIMRKPGGFRRCRVILANHPELYPLDNICAWLHHETTGLWPNEGCHHPGMKNCRRKLRGVTRGSLWSDSEFNNRLDRLTPGKGLNISITSDDDDEMEDMDGAIAELKGFCEKEADFVSFLRDDQNWEHQGTDDAGMVKSHPFIAEETDCGCRHDGKGANSSMNPTDMAAKYHCGLSGMKRMTPCAACKNTSACMTDAMQVKEPVVDVTEMDEKAIVKISDEGDVVACAKGLTEGCGYKAGDKVCGKCGAMAVTVKGGAMVPMADDDMVDDESMDDMDEEKMMGVDPAEIRRNRGKRMGTMGMKADDMTDDLFVCAATREVKSADVATPCGDCPGRCGVTEGQYDLLAIEGIAEDVLNGKVLNSGYSSDQDLFVLHVERKDGQFIEAYITGKGELDGWFRIPADEVLADSEVVDPDTAKEKALAVVEGKAASIVVSTFEGSEAYSVEIEGLDGKSYDVFVSPDGNVLGYDEYTWVDADTKDDDAEDLEVKAMYSDEERTAMAESGEALPDGSYPIANEEDLKNAIQAYGRAKDKEAAKAHIVKRAEELGLENLIPEQWGEEVPEAATDGEAMAEKSADEFVASLMEFELLAAEEELRDLLD